MGIRKSELDTPALCLDLDVMEANIESVMGTCRSHSVAWRPHSKCHKSSQIARKLVAAGALGVTCAKLGEAEVMGAGGITDLLIANLVVGEKRIGHINVCISIYFKMTCACCVLSNNPIIIVTSPSRIVAFHGTPA
mgnify:CR=1 FL=1